MRSCFGVRGLWQRALRLAATAPGLAAMAPGVAVLGLLAGCAPGGSLPLLKDPASAAYLLGPGDQLHMITFGDADLSGDFNVSDAGRLDLPLIGSFPAAGKSTEALAADIAAALRDRKILNDPHVSLEVTAYRPIFVLGEVKNPGSYPYQPGMTTLTAVAVAGGYTYRAFDSYAEVVRNAGGHAEDGRVMPDSTILPGDVVRVLERNF
jgi:polysaccharide export outer membrane protein